MEQRRPKSLIRKGLPESLPTSVHRNYFLVGATDRDVLDRALEKYRPDRSEPILIGSEKLLNPALKQLMSFYRLRIDEIKDEAVTCYTRWLESVGLIVVPP